MTKTSFTELCEKRAIYEATHKIPYCGLISQFLQGDVSRHLIYTFLENLFKPSHQFVCVTKGSRSFSNREKRE